MAEQTKADLAARVAELEAENARLRAVGQGATAEPYRPVRPHLSEGERQDLEQYGVTNSPFTGARLTASGEGVEAKTATARTADADADTTGRDRADVVGLDYIPVDRTLVEPAREGIQR